MSETLEALSRYLGILPSYGDVTGEAHRTSPQTARAILASMGHEVGDEAAEAALLDRIETDAARRRLPQWHICTPGHVATPPGFDPDADWTLIREEADGAHGGAGEDAAQQGRGALPALPLGIHKVQQHGETCWLITAPDRLPDAPRSWGVTVPLYGIGGARHPIGTYGDLAQAAGALSRAGAGFVGVNPIHAGFPADPGAFSPYSPSSRRRLSVLHIETDRPAGADAGDRAADGGEGPDDTLRDGALIDYAAAAPARLAALRADHAAAGSPGPQAPDGDLLRFALHQALADRFGPYWPDWPEDYRDPASAACARFAEENAESVAFHAWAQQRAEEQLLEVRQAAGEMTLGLYLDLAVGIHPAGADTWTDPELYAHGVSLGAPPDDFSPAGQAWHLAPLRPDILAERGFVPLAQILRAQLRFARLLRIDHILGFERAFWVPDAPGVPGAYVQMPREALLAVVRLEATRAGAVIVGEDLGNVPDGLRADLAASGLLGCRVAMFEQHYGGEAVRFKAPEDYDRASLTSFSTHDLPTWAGWRKGRDLDWWERLGTLEGEALSQARAKREREVAALEQVVGGQGDEALLSYLAATPAALVAIQIEDILGLDEQPNLPGTVYDHPNWRRRLPVSMHELDRLSGTLQAARIMAQAGR
ncbi:4-alpha-glucanotransferase [Profundibacterium mesophilum]|uniref:4-alpha-glucanotransferase n=1 Tax=Profundibacterium mesophilum KAUST100406-0324 TaxID=1037889 RepID=A0A921TGJ5_9RHOB|nr:4-alpha-glucanotransferase [Profundibacterium mesophilum]KAF0677504.1 4-alpha-glucanotransferase [Profundibacterium mesophilum KAUST100406-0324]